MAGRNPFFASKEMIEGDASVLGKQYTGLRASASTSGNYTANAAVVDDYVDTAPITSEDIPAILEVLASCPSGPNRLRVFQQHKEGNCWQDSLFIMLFNQDWFREFLLGSVDQYLRIFLALGHTDLSYAVTNTVMEPNWSKWTSGVNIKTLPLVETPRKILPAKIKPIAAEFKRIYNFELPVAFWEYYCLHLHRYILLGYLFAKHPEIRNLPEPLPKRTPLASRRKSISHRNYSQMAKNFKEYVFAMLDHGMYCENFTSGIKWFTGLIRTVSAGSVDLHPYKKEGIEPVNILGYYMIAHSSVSMLKHVVSFFKCGGKWFLYDIDVAVIEFTDEDTPIIEASKLTSFIFENRIVEGEPEITTYTLTFENGTTVSSSIPTSVGWQFKYDIFKKEEGSFILVRGDAGAAAPAGGAASGAAGAGGGAAEGGGLARTRRRKRSRAQKQRSKRLRKTRKFTLY